MKSTFDIKNWLPTTKKEIEMRGWQQLDVILFSGDAYVDHPSFGAAVIGRVLENLGLRVAIVPQPNWQDDLRDFKKLGAPAMFFGVTSGNMDSMINHYTVNLRKRSDDAYSPAGKAGFRPDRAVTIYCNILKQLFPETPIVIGGIEASLRRLTHYDYWDDVLKPSILIESKADLLVYGMGEKPLEEIVAQLKSGKQISELQNIPQTAFSINQHLEKHRDWNEHKLFSFDDCKKDKIKFAQNFKIIEQESNKLHAQRLIEKTGDKLIVVNSPYPPMTEIEIDKIYDLPFTRLPHPKYHDRDAIPAYEMIRHSINIHRGCFGGCSFCTISAHQGKFVSSRSAKSVLSEVEKVTAMPDFKGHITDLGGPSANMYKMQGRDLSICETCKKPSCIFPIICKNLETNHTPLTNLYAEVRKNPKVKLASIGSGIRYDMFFDNTPNVAPDKLQYFKDLIKHHVSGRLKVAPEHTDETVLKLMRKPSFALFKKLNSLFEQLNLRENLNQQLIPYFISSHPGSTIEGMAELAVETKRMHFKLEQVQDFYPTPLTLSSIIYYTGINPNTNEKIASPKTKESKLSQRMFFFWYQKEYRQQIVHLLEKIGKKELVTKIFGK